jgi:hypothetical protein
VTGDELNSPQSPTPNPIKLRSKWIAYLIAWILALFATNPDGSLWALSWMFPLGLVAVVNRHAANAGGWGVLIGGYLVYIFHAYFYFRSKTATRTVIFYAALVVLLIANVAGCRETMVIGH